MLLLQVIRTKDRGASVSAAHRVFLEHAPLGLDDDQPAGAGVHALDFLTHCLDRTDPRPVHRVRQHHEQDQRQDRQQPDPIQVSLGRRQIEDEPGHREGEKAAATDGRHEGIHYGRYDPQQDRLLLEPPRQEQRRGGRDTRHDLKRTGIGFVDVRPAETLESPAEVLVEHDACPR